MIERKMVKKGKIHSAFVRILLTLIIFPSYFVKFDRVIVQSMDHYFSLYILNSL